MQPNRLALLVLAAFVWIAASADESPAVFELHGFRVERGTATDEQVKRVVPSLTKQLEIVESVHLPESVIAFFRTVPIVVNPELEKMNGEYQQEAGRWVVRVKPTSIPSDRAIVLHEMLHAYQHQVLKPPVPPIGRAYQEAMRTKIYPANYRDAYFLSNPKEYFAVIGEVYLFGKTERPPFNCASVKKAQPEFIRYLADLFGERDCR